LELCGWHVTVIMVRPVYPPSTSFSPVPKFAGSKFLGGASSCAALGEGPSEGVLPSESPDPVLVEGISEGVVFSSALSDPFSYTPLMGSYPTSTIDMSS